MMAEGKGESVAADAWAGDGAVGGMGGAAAVAVRKFHPHPSSDPPMT